MKPKSLGPQIAEAVKYFWQTREIQQRRQGERGAHDQGTRGAVTGGGQLDGFIALLSALLIKAGVPRDSIFLTTGGKADLPGFFRPMKEWDLLVIHENRLLAAIELKSQVGSFGNNFNNRAEEAIGMATDLWTAYRERAFQHSPQPWTGFFMLLEQTPDSTRAVRVKQSHFPVFEEFRGASYARRYELLCERLVKERLYSAACLLLSDRERGREGHFEQPSPLVGFANFSGSLLGHIHGYLNTHV